MDESVRLVGDCYNSYMPNGVNLYALWETVTVHVATSLMDESVRLVGDCYNSYMPNGVNLYALWETVTITIPTCVMG